MSNSIKRLVLVAAAVLLLALSATPANNAEQVIFSGVGSGTFSGTPTPFGFWVWCSAEGSGPGKGIYAEDFACQGALYFYALGIVKSVFGFNGDGVTPFPGGVVQNLDGTYTMRLHSADLVVKGCLLTNASALKGPKNTVNLVCAAPAGTGASGTAVVNVTGP